MKDRPKIKLEENKIKITDECTGVACRERQICYTDFREELWTLLSQHPFVNKRQTEPWALGRVKAPKVVTYWKSRTHSKSNGCANSVLGGLWKLSCPLKGLIKNLESESGQWGETGTPVKQRKQQVGRKSPELRDLWSQGIGVQIWFWSWQISYFDQDNFFICGWGKEPHLPHSITLTIRLMWLGHY